MQTFYIKKYYIEHTEQPHALPFQKAIMDSNSEKLVSVQHLTFSGREFQVLVIGAAYI